jgi:hypothetical protein
VSNKLQKSNETPGAAIEQSGKTHATYFDAFLNDELYQSPLKRIDRLKYHLREVYPKTREEWVDGFLCISYPEGDIRRMEEIAYIYLKVASSITISKDERQDLFDSLNETDDKECSKEVLDSIIEGYIEVYMS